MSRSAYIPCSAKENHNQQRHCLPSLSGFEAIGQDLYIHDEKGDVKALTEEEERAAKERSRRGVTEKLEGVKGCLSSRA